MLVSTRAPTSGAPILARPAGRYWLGWLLAVLVIILPVLFFTFTVSLLAFAAPPRLMDAQLGSVPGLLLEKPSPGLAAADLAARYRLVIPVLLLPLVTVAACIATVRALASRFGRFDVSAATVILVVVAAIMLFKWHTPQTLVPRTFVVDAILHEAEARGLAPMSVNPTPLWLHLLGFGDSSLTFGVANSLFVLFQLIGYGAFLVMLVGIVAVAAPAGRAGLTGPALHERRASLDRLIVIGVTTLIIVTTAQRGLVNWPLVYLVPAQGTALTAVSDAITLFWGALNTCILFLVLTPGHLRIFGRC